FGWPASAVSGAGSPYLESPMVLMGAARPGAPLFTDHAGHYDALLVLSFGGPEGMADVIPFLENVTRGRNIPSERLAEVAEHYYHFGGVSPINAQNRALIEALDVELRTHGIDLPIYFGNRNWEPFLLDTLRQMRNDGVRDVLVFVTSAYSSYSGCRQYREDVTRAVDELAADDMRFDKIRVFFNHPGFIEPMARYLKDELDLVPPEERAGTQVVFTAHSVPLAMAKGSAYEKQLREASRLVAELAGADRYQLAWQSRSGPPQTPWLEPDILDVLDELAAAGVQRVILLPVGFISDHLEVLFDLDEEASDRAADLGLAFSRLPTVGTDPAFVAMIRELIEERLSDHPDRRAIGLLGPSHDLCPMNCCLVGESRRPISAAADRAVL
ncbi:MAG: ferrochelatase, partial [Thermomicrobiales bacterium]|nr:ferrochelatase [Thermomicrobiales bacterium]